MLIRCSVLTLALLASTSFAYANTTVGTVSSPGGVLTVTVTLNDEGRPGYEVMHGGVPVITESRLGFLLTDAPKLERNLAGSRRSAMTGRFTSSGTMGR